MRIEYIICDATGKHLKHETFDYDDPHERGKFARAARVAWSKGRAVITRKAPVVD